MVKKRKFTYFRIELFNDFYDTEIHLAYVMQVDNKRSKTGVALICDYLFNLCKSACHSGESYV